MLTTIGILMCFQTYDGIYVDKIHLLMFTVKFDIFFRCNTTVLYQSVHTNRKTRIKRGLFYRHPL